jgi:choloylglycine hydrolase
MTALARLLLSVIVAAATAGTPALPPESPAEHCSSFALDNGGATVFGANFDQASVNAGLVFVNQRGVAKASLLAGTTGARARWVSRYASVTFNLVGFGYAWAGMNERGLVLSSMSLDETRDPPPDARPPLDTGEWGQYLLDTCATIEEVIATDTAVRIVTPDHYFVADAYGHAAAVEFLSGRMVVHTGAEMPAQVLANSTYASSVQTWLSYRHAGNTNYSRLNSSLQRFCLAADRADGFRPRDDAAAVAYAFDTLSRIAGQRFSIHSSQWSIVFDTAELRAYYRTLRHPDIRFVDLARFDPWCTGPVQMLDIHAGPAGDVADYFVDYSHDVNLDHMRSFLLDWGVVFTEGGLRWTVQHLESFPCQRYRPPRRHLSGSP